MNDQQRIRIIMLGVAGVFLAGGVYAWFSYNNEKQSQEIAETPVAPRIRATVKKPVAAPVATSETPLVTATAPTLNPGSTPVAPGPAGQKPAPAVAVEAPVVPVASKPAVTPPAPPAPAVKPAPVVAAQPAPVAQPAQPVVKPAVAIVPAVKPPTAPVTKPAVALQPLPGKPGLPAAPLKPVVAVQPAVPTTPVKPLAVTAKPAPTQIAQTLPPTNPLNPRAQAAPIAIPMPTDGGAEPEALAPVKPGVVAATTRSAASEVARKEAGRKDPMQILTALLPWPTKKLTAKEMLAASDVPPPPPDVKDGALPGKKPAKLADKLVPPPPPNAPNLTDLDLDNLPLPPSKPLIGDKLNVLSIMDDKAIVSFPKAMTKANHWPKSITLAAGEQFDSIKVVRVSPDGVTIEEDGERSLKTIPNIK